ncbi:MAG: hypothetical protein ACI9FO_001290 [Methylophagaceae bacterium]|jgi:hypothetical protein
MKKILLVLGVALIAPQLTTAQPLDEIGPYDVPRMTETLPDSFSTRSKSEHSYTKGQNTRIVKGQLTYRDQSGWLTTSEGSIQLTPAISVEDKRPISEWYKKPAKANISFLYKDNILKRVVIYP